MSFLENIIGFTEGMENISENKTKVCIETWP